MIDSFYIGAYWGSRKETLDEVVKKTIDTFRNLSDLDTQFSTWYELGISRKKALEKRVSLDMEAIKILYEKRIKKGEVDNFGYTTHFFSLGLWTGHKGEESSSINFSVGGKFETDKMSNCIVLKIPYEGMARERLLQPNKAKLILSMIIEIWNPDYAVLTSDALRDKLNVGNNIGWITYRKIAKHKTSINNEKINNGYLFNLSFLDYSDVDNAAKELITLKSLL